MTKSISRVVVRSDDAFQVIQTEHIIYLKIDNGTVTVHDIHENAFPLNIGRLRDVEKLLDQRIFFRANRNFIININYIKKFRILSRSKVCVDLNSSLDQGIIISQRNSASFKHWINEISS